MQLGAATTAAHAALFRDLQPATMQTLTRALRAALLALGDQAPTNATP
ncbi:hypothetical protein GR925_18235 [Streptomyces sp. HUCO-GS316]|nr:hypothetical protein [Streptomyces sp. HUCO-GS316]MXM65333.1 hypothetical protein [Streptomyces sp. HUCO-GS316]